MIEDSLVKDLRKHAKHRASVAWQLGGATATTVELEAAQFARVSPYTLVESVNGLRAYFGAG